EIYPLSLHDALPISATTEVAGEAPDSRLSTLNRFGGLGGALEVALSGLSQGNNLQRDVLLFLVVHAAGDPLGIGHPSFLGKADRSEEHTSELQSRGH